MLTSLDNALLARLDLTTLDAVRACKADHLVKDHPGNRDVLRLDPPGSAPLFLKRVWRAHKKDGLASLLRRGAVWSICRKEWHNCRTLQAAGIPTCPLIAFGEDNGLLWERFSFILTAAAPGQPVDEFLRGTPASPLRRRTLDHLARHIRKMHDAGLYTPDLFTRHIFVAFPDSSASQPLHAAAPAFSLIDMARLDRSSARNVRLAARDLAALNVTAPLSLVSRAERARFLHVYGPDRARTLLPMITRRANHLLKRRKFHTFFDQNIHHDA